MLDLKHPPPLPPTNASEQMKMPNDYMEYEYDGYVPPPSPLIEYGPPPSPLIEYGPPPPLPMEYNHEGHPTYTDPLLSLPIPYAASSSLPLEHPPPYAALSSSSSSPSIGNYHARYSANGPPTYGGAVAAAAEANGPPPLSSSSSFENHDEDDDYYYPLGEVPSEERMATSSSKPSKSTKTKKKKKATKAVTKRQRKTAKSVEGQADLLAARASFDEIRKKNSSYTIRDHCNALDDKIPVSLVCLQPLALSTPTYQH